MPAGPGLHSVTEGRSPVARVRRALAPIPSGRGRSGSVARSPEPARYHESNIAQADAQSARCRQLLASGVPRACTTGKAPARTAFVCSARCLARSLSGRSRAIRIWVATGSKPRAATARWSSAS